MRSHFDLLVEPREGGAPVYAPFGHRREHAILFQEAISHNINNWSADGWQTRLEAAQFIPARAPLQIETLMCVREIMTYFHVTRMVTPQKRAGFASLTVVSMQMICEWAKKGEAVPSVFESCLRKILADVCLLGIIT